MKWLKSKLGVVFLIAAAVFSVGCATTGGDSALMNDLLSERNVIRALYNEPDLTGESILVSCVDGVITLSGGVDNAAEVQLAERIALGVSGVTSVNNNLRFN